MDGENAVTILGRVIRPEAGNLPAQVAKEFLEYGFTEQDHLRIQELADRSAAGTLTEAEKNEYDAYVFAGDFVALLHAKARISLRNHPSAA